MQSEEIVSPLVKREAIHRIIASKHFHKSARLSSILLHICELEIEGRTSELNERDIGRNVFQLPEDFDPSIDGIVRSHASRLRRKLELYYLREGCRETVRVSIPRGGYQPHFEVAGFPQDSTPEQASSFEPIPEDEVDSSGRQEVPRTMTVKSNHVAKQPRKWLVAVAILLLSVTAGVASYGAWKQRSLRSSIWKEMFTDSRQTLIVPGDSSLVMWEEMQRRNVNLSEYLSGNFTKEARGSEVELKASDMLLSRRYTSMVDLDIVQKLSAIARGLNYHPLFRFARDVRPNDLKHSNVILIGSAETNPWIQMFEAPMNFVLKKNQDSTTYTIENRRPAEGEPVAWNSDPITQLHTVYCKVTYLPNSAGEGNVLLLEGTSMAGTDCAWEFLSDDTQMSQFLHRAGQSMRHVPHFEVLLKTSNLGGDAATNSVVAWRILP